MRVVIMNYLQGLADEFYNVVGLIQDDYIKLEQLSKTSMPHLSAEPTAFGKKRLGSKFGGVEHAWANIGVFGLEHKGLQDRIITGTRSGREDRSASR